MGISITNIGGVRLDLLTKEKDIRDAKHLRLNSPRHVQRFLAKVINDRRQELISSELARDLGYLSKILLEILHSTHLEERISKLEEQYEEVKK